MEICRRWPQWRRPSLRDNAPEVREAAAEALCRVGPEEMFDTILAFSREQNAWYRGERHYVQWPR